jgi:transposase
MFVRVTSTPKSPRKSVKVVASIREGLKVRQQMIHHVGIASNEAEIEKLKLLGYEFIAKAKRQAEIESGQQTLPLSSLSEEISSLKQANSRASTKRLGRKVKKSLTEILPVNQVTLADIYEEKRVIEGVHEVAGHLYDELGYNTILPHKKEQQLLRDLVLTRLGRPASKHKTQNILVSQFAKEYDLDRIYRLLDKLHTKIPEIKRHTFEKTKALMPEKVDIVFFDVTTLYFESVNTDALREFGYSKDHRFNTTQVVLALATNSDGLPIGYELFNGSKAEVKTLLASLESWKHNFDISSVCFVGDRAMMSEDNLKKLEDKGYSYVIAAKLRSMPKAVQQEIFDEHNYLPSRIGEDLAWVGEFSYNNRRLIVSYKEKRAKLDAKKRQQALTKLQKRIGNKGNTKKLITNQATLKYTTTDQSQTVIDNDKINNDAHWDGLHGVITNLQDSDKKVVDSKIILQRYARLWVIEESFRLNKHNLSMRPIYHFKPERIEAHIALCYMSYALLRHLQYRVNITQKISSNVIIEELMQVAASIYIHKETGDRYRVPGAFSHNAAKIYKAFNLTRSSDAEAIIN